MVKTYFINGFLGCGKTTFIKNLMRQEFFDNGEKTLLLLCEEGESEYDADYLKSRNIFIDSIDDEDDFTPENITEIEKTIKPTRVIVEFNGMWARKNIEFPWYWNAPIEVTLIDATTFEMYARNMKSFVSEQVRYARMVIFNRCDGMNDKLSTYRRNIKAVNTEINVIFEDKNGEMKLRFDEELPYDISQDTIKISEDSFVTFYLDTMENVDRYLDKNVELNGMIIKIDENNPNTMIVGRMVMTCCEEDISVFGFICDFCDESGLEPDDWVRVSAVVKKDYIEKYDLWYPVMKVSFFEKIEAPEKELIENI